MRPILLLCAGRAAAFKSFSYKRDTVAASTLRELADKLPPLDFERSCYERTPVSDAVAAVFGVPSRKALAVRLVSGSETRTATVVILGD